MRSLYSFACRRTVWRICPWASVRAAIVSGLFVGLALLVVEYAVLPRLERQGLVAANSWQQHNRIVAENHQRKDRHIAFPGPKGAIDTGVRAWTGHPVAKEKRTARRILVMGDSFVWNSPYHTLNHLWWRQLAIELKRRGFQDVEVVAAGSSGMSTRDQLALAQHVVPEFQPDLILWGYVSNDPDERMVKQIHTSQLDSPIPGKVRVVLGKVTPRLLALFDARRNTKLAKCYLGPEYGYEYAEWLRQIHEGDNFARYQQTVDEVRKFQQEAGVPGLLVTLPNSPHNAECEFSYEKVLPLWNAAGIPVQDNLPAFSAQFPEAAQTGPGAIVWGINPADGHPGPRTGAFLAQHTADRLEQDYAEALGPRTDRVSELRINDWLPHNLDVIPVSADTFELMYPTQDDLLPTMPLEIPTVLIALEQPVPVQEIELEGAGLKSARVWLSTYDPAERYDTQTHDDLQELRGPTLSWPVPAQLAERETSLLLIKTEVDPSNRKLTLRLRRGGAP